MGNFLGPEGFSRRRLLKLAGKSALSGAAVNLLATLDSWGADQKYGNWGTSKITDLVAPEQAPAAREAWLVFTGMGTASGKDASRRLQGMLPPRTPIAYAEYDPAGVDVPAIAGQLGKHVLRLHHTNPDARISFMGLSSGNSVEKAAIYHLAEQERILIQPARDVQLSAPWLPRNIHGDFERWIASGLNQLEGLGLPVGWTLAEAGGIAQVLYDSMQHGRVPRNALGGLPNLPEFFSAADARASHTQPIKLWMSLNRLNHTVDHYSHRQALGTSRANTQTMLWASVNDGVVNVPEAPQDGQQLYKAAQAPPPTVYIPRIDAGHANIASVAGDLSMQRWLRETGPPVYQNV